MRQVETEGKTREEAVEKALRELGVEMYEVDRIEVLDSGSRGIFGWGARPVRVRLTVERLEAPPANRSGQPAARREASRPKNASGRPKPAQPSRGQAQEQANRKGPDAGGGRPSGGGSSARSDNRKPQQRPQPGKNRNDPPAFLKPADNRKPKQTSTHPTEKPRTDEPSAASAPATDTPVASVHHEALEALRRAELFEQFEKGLIPDPSTEAAGATHAESAEPPLSEEELNRAASVLAELLAKMGVDARVSRGTTGEGGPLLTVETEQSGQIIGKNGRTLESLQYLLNRLITPEAALDCRDRVAVDCQGYLERKWQTLRDTARELARRAVDTSKIQRTRPMPPQERRVIHIALKDYPGVTTSSEGNGYTRCVRVIPVRAAATENANAEKSRNRTRRRPRRRRPGNAASGQNGT